MKSIKKTNTINILNENNIYIFKFIFKIPNMSLEILNEIELFLDFIEKEQKKKKEILIYIFEGNEKIFNLGGDLNYFITTINNKNKNDLKEYAQKCIDLIYKNLTLKNVISIAYLNGETRGGGFEMALSCDFIIGKEKQNISLPEGIMGFFPGMGAFELLSKKIGVQKTKIFLIKNKNFTTEELYEYDIIYKIIKNRNELEKELKEIEKKKKIIIEYKKIENRIENIKYKDLYQTTMEWVNFLMNLNEYELKKIKRILNKQNLIKNRK